MVIKIQSNYYPKYSIDKEKKKDWLDIKKWIGVVRIKNDPENKIQCLTYTTDLKRILRIPPSSRQYLRSFFTDRFDF